MKRVIFVILCSVSLLIAKNPIAVLETNAGVIEVELYEEKTPKSVENFIGLINKGYYDGIIFHRVIRGFMIQGGDPTGSGRGGESFFGEMFEDEIVRGLAFDEPYLLAMANRGANTNGSQFFITTAPARWLNGKHTIFGKVVAGVDIVKKIESVKTKKPADKPIEEQKIIKAYMKKVEKEKKEEK